MTSTTSPSTKQYPRFATFAVFLLFFATGASGLIYQVSWQRWLLNVFGATLYSTSTVLAAFMGGLALGSILLARKAQSIARPLVWYGIAEIGIGLAALVLPPALELCDPVFSRAYRSFSGNLPALTAIRFVIVAGLLLVPTTLMGATIPLLARFLTPNGEQAGFRVGALYALNTFGAFAGTILSGFYLIRHVGVHGTVWIAVALNIGAGLIALLLARAFDPLPTGAQAAPAPADGGSEAPDVATVKLIQLAYFVAGFCALGLEIAWSRSLVFTFEALKNTTYSFTAMLAVFLTGVAVGSAVMTPLVERHRQPVRLFATLLGLIGISSIFSFYIFHFKGYTLGAEWLEQFEKGTAGIRWTAAVGLVFLRTAAVVGLPTFCMGLAFPVAVRAVTMASRDAAQDVGRLYSYNTFGAILGSMFVGFVLLPGMGIAGTIITLGAIQLLVACVVILRDRRSEFGQKAFFVAVSVACVLIGFVRLPRPVYFQLPEDTERFVFYKEGPLATISVLENSLGYRTIYVDNVGVAGTDPILLTDQKSLAHVPMLLLNNPKSAATVGFGSGGASFSYTLYPEIQDIHCLEITRTVTEAAPTLKASNHGVVDKLTDQQVAAAKLKTGADGRVESLDVPTDDGGTTTVYPLWGWPDRWVKHDPRYRVILDDARSYLKHCGRTYDIIATDCTDLRYKSNANLYDVEYFQTCRDRITDNGMVVVWMPLAGLSEDAMKCALRSFQKVFPDMEISYPNNHPTHYILLIGTKKPLSIDVDEMRVKLKNPLIRHDLEEIGFSSPEKILTSFITGRKELAAYLAEGPLNTENTPYLEFESPRYGYGDAPLLDNLDALLNHGTNPLRLVTNDKQREAIRTSTEKYLAALPHIIKGHRLYRQLNIREAAREYMTARELNPGDPSIDFLLKFDELRRKIAGQPNNFWAQWMLGEVLAMQKQDSEAVTVLNRAVTLPLSNKPAARQQEEPWRREAAATLATLYERNGKADRAAEVRSRWLR